MKDFSIFVYLFFMIMIAGFKAVAQITPDGTLPNNSQVLPVPNGSLIEGGTRSGGNLFHSFERFSVPTGMAAIFNNPIDVENIFSRVTGSQASHIDGLLRTQGATNLFFLNPNGIVFGPNAQLFIGGSFVGTTASNIIFENGQSFGRDAPDFSLTVNVPVGLDFSGNSGGIEVNNVGHQISKESLAVPIDRSTKTQGLQVVPGSSISLLGDSITFNGGVLTVNGGNLTVASLKRGSVGLEQTQYGFAFSFPLPIERSPLIFRQRSLLDGALGGNTIYVYGSNIELRDRSVIATQNLLTIPDGTIRIDAERLSILGGTLTNPMEEVGIIESGIISESLGLGNGSDLLITSKSFSLSGGGALGTVAYLSGSPGSIGIKTQDDVYFTGISIAPLIPSGIGSINLGSSASGSIQIEASSVNLEKFGSISSITLSSLGPSISIKAEVLNIRQGGLVISSSFGDGLSGDITVNAGAVTVEGYAPNLPGPDALFRIPILSTNLENLSGIFTNSTGDGIGSARISITAQSLRVIDGAIVGSGTLGFANTATIEVKAKDILIEGTSPNSPSQIASRTIGEGNSNNIFVLADTIILRDGGTINTSTTAEGDAATIFVRASERLSIQENSNNSPYVTEISASASLLDDKIFELLGKTPTVPTGSGGQIFLDSPRIDVRGGRITTSTIFGRGGNIEISADSLGLRDGGEISTSSTLRGQGGNIVIRTNTTGLFRGSRIEATAVNGDGGAISIETNFLFSDGSETISAISALGRDGTVNINTQPYTFSAIDMRYLGAPRPSEVALRACRRYGRQIARGGVGQTPRASNGAGRSFDDLIPLGQAVYMETSGDGKARFLNCFEYLERFPSEADAPEDGEG